MHEFALAHSIRDIAIEAAEAHGALAVRRVRCRVGVLRQIVPSMMRTAFEACCVETLAAGAELLLETDPISLECRACGAVEQADEMLFACPRCAAVDVRLTGGSALEITSIDIDLEDDHGNHRAAERAGTQRCHGG